MSEEFKTKEVTELLVACHRRCCVCHRWCGSKMEIDHIVPKADSNDNSIDNAIAVCFDCHAEIHHYNNKHPKGRKFSSDEIRGHKEQWLEICREHPEIFSQPLSQDVGCIGSLIDELEFNHHIATNVSGSFFCRLRDNEFQRAINAGIISILADDIRSFVLAAYTSVGKANSAIEAYNVIGLRDGGMMVSQTAEQIKVCAPVLERAKKSLEEFVNSDEQQTRAEQKDQ